VSKPPGKGASVTQPATPQLRALALAARPDWNADQLDVAIAQCVVAGWSPDKTLLTVARLLVVEDSEARDLDVQAAQWPSPAARPNWDTGRG